MSEMKTRYERAEQFLPWNLKSKLKNISLQPHWLDERLFWFRRDLQKGYEFILVDSELITQKLAFDHQRLALTLTELLGQTVNPQQLPIETFSCCAENQWRFVIDSQVFYGQASTA